MRDLVFIFEVWTTEVLKYLVVEVTADHAPEQFDMVERQEAIEIMTEQIGSLNLEDETKVLDLIGVYEEGVKIWHEGVEDDSR